MAYYDKTWQDRAWQTDARAENSGLNQAFVNDVFHNVADRYDLMNDVLSGGCHRLWKRFMVSRLNLPQKLPYKALDIAGGTGDITRRMAFKAPQGDITVYDINADMLEVAQKRATEEQWPAKVSFCEGCATTLPFQASTFDVVTLAFGIRNVPDRQAALREVFRVLRPGGQFACLEFSRVTLPIFDKLYEGFGAYVIPSLGAMLASNAEAYRYLVESIKRFPPVEAFSHEIADAGFENLSYQTLTGGIAALHIGWKF